MLEYLREETREELTENILPYWMENCLDPAGGFYGRIKGDGEVVPDSPRGGILNARILWTFASAYRLTGREEYLMTAMRARDEILNKFFDPDFGGIYWSLDREGRPLETKKQIYAIAFAIYGLSELYRACADRLALEAAISLFHSIEDHSHDMMRGGYLEAFTRSWGPIGDMRLSDKDQNDAKTMNTHLHILEGYTALYRVWKDDFLAQRLRELIHIFLDRIILPDGHLALFFTEDWTVTSHVTSYGHDIECSWLLCEAAEALGDQGLLQEVRTACTRTAEAALEGWSPDGGMVYERDLNDGAIDADRHWWVQAETVVGCLWQWKHAVHAGLSEPECRSWMDRALAQWLFIRKHLICPDGEWYWSVRADGSANTDDDRAGFWKCPYHNGRMCMEVLTIV
ncbi:MAG: AGE family epimerase/isomerase [Bacteroidales bacterium]|nr:AGE family epimerase/isomerase [Candidatus Cryptobacteroides onthequi]